MAHGSSCTVQLEGGRETVIERECHIERQRLTFVVVVLLIVTGGRWFGVSLFVFAEK